MFKDRFKYYKSRNPPPTYEDVIDIDSSTSEQVRRTLFQCDKQNHQAQNEFGLKPADSWEVSEFPQIPGLLFIKNPFTAYGQRYWITRCLRDYSRRPNKLNIDAHGVLGEREEWWDICTRGDPRSRELVPKLRWATLGYHHNWDTKHYSEEERVEVPRDLGDMTGLITKALGFREFRAQAAIINFYRMNSTLAGHVDHSEEDLEAPLVSVSFGQSAIFLIGGVRSEDFAQAIFVRSGDVLVMSGEARLRYHGIPRIVRNQDVPWNEVEESQHTGDRDWIWAEEFISDARINMNIRQVLKTGQTQLREIEFRDVTKIDD